MKSIHRKTEADFRYTNVVVASDPPTRPPVQYPLTQQSAGPSCPSSPKPTCQLPTALWQHVLVSPVLPATLFGFLHHHPFQLACWSSHLWSMLCLLGQPADTAWHGLGFFALRNPHPVGKSTPILHGHELAVIKAMPMPGSGGPALMATAPSLTRHMFLVKVGDPNPFPFKGFFLNIFACMERVRHVMP